LRQANKEEFERYIGHAHMKLRKPMRDERVGNPGGGAGTGAELGARTKTIGALAAERFAATITTDASATTSANVAAGSTAKRTRSLYTILEEGG
jgi:hypothetical protein